ncbi:unnamed protein product [Cercopithifilaria johnstoni]|uniref:Uncharacterized protein n=1 Tax=Cercopithifilaria johnstoni TaxID=2874296 RepID=A0A8J2MV69_9BILA|nr:unnamed protein product [Cercopithifilaria johnstoni]
MKSTPIFAIIIAISIPIIVTAKMRSVGVRGTVICDGTPISNGEVELYDERNAARADALLAKTKTDANGRFTIKGNSKRSRFDPHFTISHKCRAKLCTRKMLLRVPEKYTTSGPNPSEIYDIGVIDAKIKFPTETKTCPI